jgi:hypothetical protein
MEFKHVTIVNPTETSNVMKKKEKKMRVQTHTWNIYDCELSHQKQINILNYIYSNLITNNINSERINSERINSERINNKDICNDVSNKYLNIFINNLKNKISSYKQQDILKKKLDSNNFINFENIIYLLHESQLTCCYCHKEIYILYKQVREMSQWTLDRIDNNSGHNFGNLVISCLKCNLKRRRINKNSFMLTKNMTIERENYNFEDVDINDIDFEFDETQTRIIHIEEEEKYKINESKVSSI